jgi:hypothetical protein
MNFHFNSYEKVNVGKFKIIKPIPEPIYQVLIFHDGEIIKKMSLDIFKDNNALIVFGIMKLDSKSLIEVDNVIYEVEDCLFCRSSIEIHVRIDRKYAYKYDFSF